MICCRRGRGATLHDPAEAERAASIYTIMQTARLNTVNPEARLRDTLGRIAEPDQPHRQTDAMAIISAALIQQP
jgi:IS66 C-terminal element